MSFDEFENDDEFEQAIASKDVMVRAKALASRGAQLVREHSDMHLAGIYLEEAWTVFVSRSAFGDAAGIAVAYSMTLNEFKRYGAAEEVLLAGADYAKQVMDTGTEILCLANAGWVARRTKDHVKTSLYYGQARALAKESSHWLTSHVSNEYARALRKLKRYAEAEEVLRESVMAARESGDEYPMLMHDAELASVLIERGNFVEALAAATEAYNVASYTDNKREMQRAQFNKAKALNLLERYEAAIAELKELATRKHYQTKVKHRLRVDFELAKAYFGSFEISSALGLLTKLVPLLVSFGLLREAQTARYLLAHSHMIEGDDLEAEQVCAEFMANKEHASPADLVSCAQLMESIYRTRGDWLGAIGPLELLTSDPTKQFEPWYADALQSLGLAYMKVGRMDDALVAVDSAMVVFGSKNLCLGDAYSVKAEAASLAGDVVLARKFGRKAIKAYLSAGQGYRAEGLAKYL